jgi:radical SAM protein with 4Fe4S-binding SPASM domain
MPVEIFQKILDDLAEINFRGVIAPNLYGEPLLDKRLLYLVKLARKKLPKSTIRIYTNGDYLIVGTYKELVNAGVSEFVVTQHGPTMSTAIKELFTYLNEPDIKRVPILYQIFDETTPLFNRGGLVKPKKILYEPICAEYYNYLSVDYDGNVILCCNDYHSSIKLGNVREENLFDIWWSEDYRKLRQNLREKIYSNLICKRCVGTYIDTI